MQSPEPPLSGSQPGMPRVEAPVDSSFLCTNTSVPDSTTKAIGGEKEEQNGSVLGSQELSPKPSLPATATLESQEESATTDETATQGSSLPPSPSAKGSRFSVNLSNVGLPTMATNLGLSQANTERAADMASEVKKNVVNMWHAWFPSQMASSSAPGTTTTPSATATPPPVTNDSSTVTENPIRPFTSGSQSLSQPRPAKAQRMNSYTLGSKLSGDAVKTLGGLSLPQSIRGFSMDIPGRRSVSPSPAGSVVTQEPQSMVDDEVVHEANDPIAARSRTCVPPPSNLSNEPIHLMGKFYPPSPTQWTDFQRDFTQGLIWCTYRHSYPPIRPSNFTTDVGWGCMLRSGQGLLSNALAIQFMGRGWNRPGPGDPHWEDYVRLLSWFLDDMNARSPFSVHRIALLGKQLGKNIGEWFGPSTTSQVTKALVHNFPECNLGVYVTTDGVIYKDQVEEAAKTKQTGEFGHLLILVTIRLGIDKLNPIYNEAIKATFEFPQTLGIAGGRPSSSYYFVGYQGDDLFYLDPHHSRCVVETKELNEYTAEDFATYHCDTIRKIDINAIDPSMLLAFYCRDRAEFDALCTRVKELNGRTNLGMGASIFTIGDRAPDYEDDADGRLLSVADEDDDELELIL